MAKLGKLRYIRGQKKGWEDIDRVLHYQYQITLQILKPVETKQIGSRHDNNSFAGHFGIEKIQNLIAQKY